MNQRIRTYDVVRAPTKDVTATYVKPIGEFVPATVGPAIERLISRLAMVHGVRKNLTDHTVVSEISASEIALRGRLDLAWDTAARALDSLEDVVREAEEIDRKNAAPTIAGGPRKTKDSKPFTAADMNRANSEFWKK